MSDTLLFLTGTSVFSLMLVGVFLTIVEFHRLTKRDKRRKRARKENAEAKEHSIPGRDGR